MDTRDQARHDAPELFEGGERVGAYLYGGLLFDIGRPDGHQKAVAARANKEHNLRAPFTPIIG